MFWPELTEHEGTLLLAERLKQGDFERWRDQFDGDLARVEAMVNHVHESDLFPYDEQALPDAVGARVFDVLAACWQARLNQACPSGAYVVDLSHGTNDRQITFYRRA